MRCQELIELEDGDMASCHEEAAYTTCRIKNGAVCEAHKCRCSRPLAEVDDAARREASEMAQCRSCGKTLVPLSGIADGCPCNSPRGVNHGLVSEFVCTCIECDPAQIGSARQVPYLVDALRARVDRLRGVVAYARHAHACDAYTEDGEHAPCRCGYEGAEAALQPGDLEDT